jgi:UDP-N-acetylmuramate dehydrogenase
MRLTLQENIPLAPMTTLGIGGPARYFVEAADEAGVTEAYLFAKERGLPLFVLGGGSNLVIADDGFPGVVVRMAIPGRELIPGEGSDPKKKIYRVGAGTNWDSFVEFCIGQNLAGIECLSGIPGSVGGTPVQNVGAYGQDVSSVILSVRAFDRVEERICELDLAACCFTYRQSIFNTVARGRYIVLSVTYALDPNGAPTLRYADVERYFRRSPLRPSLRDVREAVRSIRRRKAMLLDPKDPNSRSVGSFFKNPVVHLTKFEEIAKQFPGTQIPHYPVAPAASGHQEPPAVKLAAAWLIEQAGFTKGYPASSERPSRVGISSKHTLALINRGGASAQDIIALMEEIQAKVRSRFDVQLVAEPAFIGFNRTATV